MNNMDGEQKMLILALVILSATFIFISTQVIGCMESDRQAALALRSIETRE